MMVFLAVLCVFLLVLAIAATVDRNYYKNVVNGQDQLIASQDQQLDLYKKTAEVRDTLIAQLNGEVLLLQEKIKVQEKTIADLEFLDRHSDLSC